MTLEGCSNRHNILPGGDCFVFEPLLNHAAHHQVHEQSNAKSIREDIDTAEDSPAHASTVRFLLSKFFSIEPAFKDLEGLRV